MRKFETEEGRLVSYDTVLEYYQMLKRPILPGRDNSSMSGSKSFTGTRDYEEAEKLMVGGDRDSLKEMVDIKTKLDQEYQTTPSNRRITYEGPTGYTPIVPNAILGLPNSMRNTKVIKRDSKIVDIVVNQSWAAMTPKHVISYNGAFALSYIDVLERDGYRVNLYVGKISQRDNGDSYGHVVRIKKDSEPLNIYQVSFYLINPSYLRRIAFRIDENEQYLYDETNSGYGRASGYHASREMIRKSLNSNTLIFIDSGTGIRPDQEFDENFKIIQKEFDKTVYI